MEDAGAVEYARMEALSPIAEFKEGPLSVEALKSESGHRFVLVQNERNPHEAISLAPEEAEKLSTLLQHAVKAHSDDE